MANYSNLVTSGSTPMTSALQNKISPQPLQPLVGMLKPKPFIPTSPINQPIASHTVKPDGTVVHKYVDPTKQTASVVNSGASTPTPTAKPVTPNFTAGGVSNGGQQPIPNPTPQNVASQPITDSLVTAPNANTAQPTTPSTGGNQFIPQIAGSATANPGIANDSTAITQQYGNLINPLLQNATGQALGEASGMGTTRVGEGNSAATLGAAGNLISGLTAQENQQLAAQGQRLTAQQQQTSGLASAGSLAQPSGNFPFVFNPATGTFSAPGVNGGGGSTGAPTLTYNPQVDAQTLAQQVMAGKVTYSDALSAMSYAGNNIGSGLLQSAITAAGGNLAQIQAQTGANQGSVSDFTTKINAIKSQAPAADQAFTALKSYANNLGISNDTPILNGISQLYAGTVGGEQKTADATAAFQAQLQAVRAAWVAIEGGDPVAAIPDNPTPSQIAAKQAQLKQDAGYKVDALQNQLDSIKQGGSSTPSSSGGTGTYTSTSGNTYNLPY